MCFAYELIVNSLIAFPCSAPGGTAQWDKNDKIVNGTMGLESDKIKLNLLKISKNVVASIIVYLQFFFLISAPYGTYVCTPGHDECKCRQSLFNLSITDSKVFPLMTRFQMVIMNCGQQGEANHH